jgi:purine-binding chemotaxis protein CheW
MSRGDDNIGEVEEELQFVAFRVGTQQFALEIHSVTEVIAFSPITPLPGGSSSVEGMVDLRGRLLPVIDLRKRLRLENILNTAFTRILIVQVHSKLTGLIVDEADRVFTIAVQSIEPPPESSPPFVLALAAHAGDLFIILDLEMLLSDLEGLPERAQLQAPTHR